MAESGILPRSGSGLASLSAPDEGGGGTAAAKSSLRILIVEDDYFVATNLEYRLKEEGYEVVGVAVSADDAERMTREFQPTLAIMDIRLAGKSDGVEAAIRLRTTYGVPSIFATAHGDADTQRRAAQAAPLGWINKPYSIETVIAAIRSAVLD